MHSGCLPAFPVLVANVCAVKLGRWSDDLRRGDSVDFQDARAPADACLETRTTAHPLDGNRSISFSRTKPSQEWVPSCRCGRPPERNLTEQHGDAIPRLAGELDADGQWPLLHR